MSRNNSRNNSEGGGSAAAEAEATTTPALHPMRAELCKRLSLTAPSDGQLFTDACREIDKLRERIRTGK